MKKLISTILLFSMVLTLSFAAPKKGKIKGIKLDKKNRFAIGGIGLGSINWSKVSISDKGEIIWNETNDYQECGWAIMKIDMSQYAGLRFEFVPNPNQDVQIKIRNYVYDGEYGYTVPKDGIVYAFFNGQGRNWGDMKIPERKDAFSIYIGISKGQNEKTVIKSVELLKKENVPDASNLELLGVQFGSSNWQSRVIGNEITWPKGYSDGNVGWNLEGIDLSEYDRIRVELESNDATGLHLSLNEKDGKNYHTFSNQIEPNVYEADLSGEGYSYKNEDSVTPDRSNGLSIDIRTWNEKPRKTEQKTVVKSVQLLKGKHTINENLMIEGKSFGSSGWNSMVYDGGIIEWDVKDKSAMAGWNLTDIDLSGYEKVRIEIESSDTPVDLRMVQYDEKNKDRRCDLYFSEIAPNILEANLNGSEHTNSWEEGGYKWDGTKRIDELQIHVDPITKKGMRTKIKSVTLLTEDDSAPQPKKLMLNGAKLGSIRNNAWVDEDFAINWQKENWAKCGWNFENLEGDILYVVVTSTDVPLRLRIREYANGNEVSYIDDGSHIFRIELKTKKQIDAKGNKKAPEWEKLTKPFDYSQGGEIVLEPVNGVSKDGKKTVVEYIKVE